MKGVMVTHQQRKRMKIQKNREFNPCVRYCRNIRRLTGMIDLYKEDLTVTCSEIF